MPLFCRFAVGTSTTSYKVDISVVAGEWTHVALVYYGPQEGISVCHNGNLIGSDLVGSPKSHSNTSGNVVVGKIFADHDWQCADVTLDELYFWDQPFGAAVIQHLYNTFWK